MFDLFILFLRLRLHEEWLEKERLAQEEFRLRCEREEAAQKRKEEEEVIYSMAYIYHRRHVRDLDTQMMSC